MKKQVFAKGKNMISAAIWSAALLMVVIVGLLTMLPAASRKDKTQTGDDTHTAVTDQAEKKTVKTVVSPRENSETAVTEEEREK
ncbi:hypothetical protein F3G48_33260, partial [Pseudomonas aeruginosa]